MATLAPGLWEHLRAVPTMAYRGPVPPSGQDVVTAPPVTSCWVVETGAALIDGGGRSWRVEAGGTLVVPPHWRRRQRFATGTRLTSLSARLEWDSGRPLVPLAAPVELREGPLAAAARAAVATLGGEGFVAYGERRLDAAGWLRWQAAFAAFVTALVEALTAAGQAVAEPGSGDARLDRALAQLATAPIGALPWPALAKASGLGRTQLDRLCRERLGITPRAARDRELLRRATTLLADGELTVAAVAERLGFRDPSHFVKWHRRQAGVTPRRARLGGA
jgi:AraC-like DNA-binding protein